MKRRRRNIKQRMEDSSYDLNLAPMLDMMVALVPFLLLSIAFVRLVVVEAKIPQPVAKAIEEDRNKKDREVNIQMKVHSKDGVTLVVNEKSKKKIEYKIPLNGGAYNVDAVHKKLIEIKLQHPKVFRLEILPIDGVIYKDLISLMDSARQRLNEDPVILIYDEEQKKKVPSNLIFPDVIFGNVVEG